MKPWLFALALLAGCGSGAVTDPSTQPQPKPLAVSPASATALPGLVTSFTVSGGSGAYTVSSDNQGVVPSPVVAGNTFAIVPAAVAAETKLTLSVRDGTSAVSVPVTVEPIATAPLTVQPASVAFQGVTPGTCASGISADVLIFGGHPPYVISQHGAFNITQVVSDNPGRVTVGTTGQCAAPTSIAVVDAVGTAVTFIASNLVSTATTPAPVALSAAPAAVTLASCTDQARVVLTGGKGSYYSAAGSNAVAATPETSSVWLIYRRPGGDNTTPYPNTVPVAFSDGSASITVPVTLSPAAIGKCP